MNVVIVGGSGHGSVIADALEKAGTLDLLGFLDGSLALGARVNGREIIGRVADLPRLRAERQVQGVIVGIGDNWMRSNLVRTIRGLAPDISFPNVIHPSAQIAGHVQLGQGNVILAGAIVNCGTVLGDFCILNTNSAVDHDSVLADYVSLAPKACTGGNCQIGEYTAICLGANLVHQIRVGAHSVVGAGSTVLHDLPADVVAYGTPARIVRQRNIGEKYLSKVNVSVAEGVE